MKPSKLNAAESRVAHILQEYADRGVFGSFSGPRKSGSHIEYDFAWIMNANFRLIHNARKRSLRFHELLNDIEPRGDIEKVVRNWTKERFDPKLPAHRRLDKNKCALKCTRRGERLSIEINYKQGEEAYATKRLLNLVNELIVGKLAAEQFNYMVGAFNLPQE